MKDDKLSIEELCKPLSAKVEPRGDAWPRVNREARGRTKKLIADREAIKSMETKTDAE